MRAKSFLAEYRREGFAVVRGLLPPDALPPLRHAFDQLLTQARSIAAGERAAPEGCAFVVQTDPFRLSRVVWAGGASPAIAALGDHPAFLGAAAAALGSRQLVQLIQQAHFKLPGDGVRFDWHQDASNRRYGSELWHDVDGCGSFVQIALAIDAMDDANGALRVLPGTHRLGFVADPRTGALPPLASLTDTEPVTLRLQPGDAAVFGPFLVHGSPPNEGDRARRLLLQGYALPDANRRVYPGCGLGIPREAL